MNGIKGNAWAMLITFVQKDDADFSQGSLSDQR
jgi:hypothetical protein